MARILNRKLWRDLWTSGAELGPVVVLLALGTAALVVLGTGYRNLRTAQEEYYRLCRMADFWVDFERMPRTWVDRVMPLPGVGGYELRIVKYVSVHLPQAGKPIGGLAVSLPELRRPLVNDIVLLSGRYFDPSRKRQIIVSRQFANSHGLMPGQSLELVLNGRLEKFEIVGVAISSEFVYLVPPGALVPEAYSFGVFYLPEKLLEEAFDMPGAVNQLVGRFTSKASPRQEVSLQKLEQILQPAGMRSRYLRSEQMSHMVLSQELTNLRLFAIGTPAVFLAVAAFILTILMGRIIEREQTVIGVLKAVGYTDAEITWHYARLPLLMALGGCVLGATLGQWTASAMTELYRQYFEFPNLVSRFYPSVWMVAVVANGASVLLGSWHGLRRVLRLQPAEAMQPPRARLGGPVFLERYKILWQLLSWRWRGAFREVCRSPFRSLFQMLSIAMAVGLLSSSFFMVDSTWYLLDFQYSKVARGDYDVSFSGKQSAVTTYLAVDKLPGVLHTEPVLHLPCTLTYGVRSRKVAVTGLVQGSMLTVPRDQQGRRAFLPRDGLLLSRALADTLGVRPGHKVRVHFTEGAHRYHDVRVAGVVDTFIGLEAFADLKFLSKLIKHSPICSGVQIKSVATHPEGEAMAQSLRKWGSCQSITARSSAVESLRRLVSQSLGVFLVVVVIHAGGLFLGTMIGCQAVAAARRQKEMATMYSLGYTPTEIGGLFFREAAILTAAALVLGIPLGILCTEGLFRAFESELFRFPVVFGWSVVLRTIVFAVIGQLLAHGLLLMRLWKLDLRQAMYTRE